MWQNPRNEIDFQLKKKAEQEKRKNGFEQSQHVSY